MEEEEGEEEGGEGVVGSVVATGWGLEDEDWV